jgi:hypothetical protein
MSYDKPKVTIDLDQYLELKKEFERKKEELDYDHAYSLLFHSIRHAGARRISEESAIKEFNDHSGFTVSMEKNHAAGSLHFKMKRR